MNNRNDRKQGENREWENDMDRQEGRTPDYNKSEKDGREGKTGFVHELLDYIKMIVIVLAAVVALEQFVIVNAQIPSASMEPTIMTGDHIFGNRLAYKTKDPERFDIVIFKYPDDESRLFIKRVIGLPGDTIDIRNGDVYVNGSETPLPDDYCAEPDSTDTGYLTFPITVPDDCYFMLGDNRLYSKDSRYWNNTFVEKDKILGKAFLRYWPLNKICRLGNDVTEGNQ